MIPGDVSDQVFKQCTACKHYWENREQFLSDPGVSVIGYQANFAALEEGYFLFTHEEPDCRTTLAFQAGDFSDLYKGPIFEERLKGSAQCDGHCLRQGDIEPCSNKCECAYVRQVLQIVRNWKKRAA